MRLFRLRHYLFSRLWFVPVLCVLAGITLSFLTIALDRAAGGSAVPTSVSGDPDAALAILTTVAVSMVTLTGLVLTITMVVVQLAIGQFSPRILRTILHDRPSQIAIGVFVATFAHAILVMREVSAQGEDGGSVPGLAVVVAFVLILVSIIVLVLYVNHIGQSLRVASLVDSVGDEMRTRMDELYPLEPNDPGADVDEPALEYGRSVQAPASGVLFRLAQDELLVEATKADCVLEVVPRIGDYVPEGAPLYRVHGDADRLDRKAVARATAFGSDRTMHQDLAYGFRMLVDVVVRSLSVSINDPTTAVQAIDRIHDSLRQLAPRPFPSGRCVDDDGHLRVVIRMMSWDGFMRLAVDEIRLTAGVSIQVTRRLQAMLEDLLEVVPADRRPAVERQLALVAELVRRNFEDSDDAEAAVRADLQGLGSGVDFVESEAASPARR